MERTNDEKSIVLQLILSEHFPSISGVRILRVLEKVVEDNVILRDSILVRLGEPDNIEVFLPKWTTLENLKPAIAKIRRKLKERGRK
jgi:hypothetical protein